MMEGLDHGFGMSSGSQAVALWQELARDAKQPPTADGAAVGRALDPAAAGTLARAVPSILELIGVEAAAQAFASQVDALLRNVRGDVLAKAVEQLDLSDRRRLVNTATDLLSPPALVPLVVACAPSFKQTVSQPFRELVDKLATQAETLEEPVRAKADAAFRSLVRHVIDRWSASQVNSGSTGFEAMFQQEKAAVAHSEVSPGPARVLQLALETGALGQIVWTALKAQGESEDGMRDLLDMIKRAPAGHARDTIAEQIATPARLTRLLEEDPIDWDAADTLVQHLGPNAIRPLLDQLVESNHRASRRAIMDRLVRFGAELQPLVLERLDDARWYVVRNMISLLREAGCSLEKVPIEKFVSHSDARVRRETLQLRLENPALREQALTEALADTDKGVLRTALQAARSSLPDSAVTTLARRVLEADFPAEFRVIGIYLLGRSGYPTALESLLRYVHGGKTLLGKTKLAPKSAEMLAALSGLARSWPHERRARELLDLAEKSTDEQVKNALHAVGGGEER